MYDLLQGGCIRLHWFELLSINGRGHSPRYFPQRSVGKWLSPACYQKVGKLTRRARFAQTSSYSSFLEPPLFLKLKLDITSDKA